MLVEFWWMWMFHESPVGAPKIMLGGWKVHVLGEVALLFQAKVVKIVQQGPKNRPIFRSTQVRDRDR